MPRLKRRRAVSRDDWSDDQIMFLRDGNWLWCQFTPWSSPEFVPFDQRDSWPPDDVKADIAAAWQYHGERLMEEYPDDCPLFGELFVEQGLSHRAAHDEHMRQWREHHHGKGQRLPAEYIDPNAD